MRKNIYGEEPLKKKQVATPESPDVDYTFNEVEYGLNIDDSIVYLHGDIVIGCLFDFISNKLLIFIFPCKNTIRNQIYYFDGQINS